MKNTLRQFCYGFSFSNFSFAAPVLVALALASPLVLQSSAEDDLVVGATEDAQLPSLAKSVQVMVEMNAVPAAVPYAAALKQAQAQADAARNYALAHPNAKSSKALLKQKPGAAQISSNAASQIKTAVKQIDQAQKAMLPALTGANIDGQVIFRVQRAYNGVAMIVSPDKIAAIAALPGVKAVHPMHPKFLTDAFSDIDFLVTRPVWTSGIGNHGETIKVADIDTGLDYIHTNFGGSGLASDYALTTDLVAAPGQFPTAKIPGGTDLVGNAYTGSNVPVPDSNPYDCNGHGTATASLITGFGVTSAGATYTGTYDGTNPIMSTLKCSPGFAPNALLYPVRVFGCAGSTNVVVEAIEWCMDPNNDGDFTDRMDVINMSLGANEGFADDPDDVAASNAASIGILVCSAAGNAGDSYYIHSSPAAAGGTLGVAATFNNQNGYIFDSTLTVNAPPAFVGQVNNTIYTTTSPHTSATGDLVYASPHDGSTPLTNAAFCVGKIVMVDRVPGFGSAASVNCQAAGAIGIIDKADLLGAGGNPFLLTTSPTLTKPMVVCSKAFGDTLEAEAAFDANGVSTAGVNVTIAPASTGAQITAGAATDTMPTYSSRGPRLPDSAIKPDISAPAEVVGVALPFSGNGIENFNGTSSATPHVAGMMALLRQLHPTWSVQELNALACDTATHNLFTDTTYTTQYGVGRVGAGRIDVGNAGAASVVAFNGTDPNLIGVSFGVVETPVAGSSSITKNITVENKGTTPVTYTTSVVYDPNISGAAAAFSLGSAGFTITGGSTMTVPVTFAAAGSKLLHDREASVSATLGGNPRQWLTEIAGYAVFTPSDASPVLRVALYAAPKPTSAMHATTTGFVPTASTGSFTINLAGTPVNTPTGPNPGTGLGTGFDILSLVKPFELQYASTDAGAPAASTDPNVIKYVGITSDYPNRGAGALKAATRIVWGIEGFGNAATPDFASSDKEIFVDTFTGSGPGGGPPITAGVPDGIPDWAVFLSSISGQVNVYVADWVNLHSGALIAQTFTNGLNSGTADTNAFNNSAVTIRVNASTLGLLAGGTGPSLLQYQVVTFDRSNNEVDETPVLTYDVANPGLDVESSFATSTKTQNAGALFEDFMYNDLATNAIGVNYNGTNFQNNGSLGVLLLHMHNGTGSHADVVAFRKPTVSGFSPTSGKVGNFITITGANFGAGTTVKFFNNKTATINVLTSNTLVATVPVGAVTGPIRVSNAAGSSTAVGNFTVLP